MEAPRQGLALPTVKQQLHVLMACSRWQQAFSEGRPCLPCSLMRVNRT